MTPSKMGKTKNLIFYSLNGELYTRTGQTVFTIFWKQKMFKITQLYHNVLCPGFYVAFRTLLVGLMFCVLKFYFVEFYGMFTSSPAWRLKMHVLCKVGKNIIFQNKILLVMFYRHTLFIPLATQGAYQIHFGWALIITLVYV